MPETSEPSAAARGRVILDSAAFAAAFTAWRAAIEVTLRAGPPHALVGIKRRGAVLARRLWEDLRGTLPRLELGEVDISLYRDDYHLQNSQPHVLGTEIAFKVDGCTIVLVDDVLYTGRTVRAALDLILDFGRPRAIRLAAFVDRGHRELPIAADHCGRRVETRPEDRVQVRLRETDGVDEVSLLRAAAPPAP